MEKEWEELYQKYLKETLDLVFKDSNGEKFDTYSFSEYENKPGTFNVLATREIQKKLGIPEQVIHFFDNIARVTDKKGWYIYIDENFNRINDQKYDKAGHFRDGYALVKKEFDFETLYNFIDKNGHKISDTWFEEVVECESYNDCFMVRTSVGWRLINSKGEPLTNEVYNYIKRIIGQNGKYNFIVVKGEKYTIVDERGNQVIKKWYSDIEDPYESCYEVKNDDDKWNIIDADGNELLKNWYWGIDLSSSSLKDGYIVARINDFEYSRQYNIIDKDENMILSQNYEDVEYFHDDLFIVKTSSWSRDYNIVDKDGDLKCTQYYDGITKCENGCAIVRLGNQYNIIDANCNELFDWGIVTIRDDEWFHDGFIRVCINGKYNYSDDKGNLLFKEGFDHAYEFEDGVAKVYKGNTCYLIDTRGNIIFDRPIKHLSSYPSNSKICNEMELHPLNSNCFCRFGYSTLANPLEQLGVACKKIDLKGYQVDKNISGYQCTKDNDKFTIKYKPIKVFDSQFVLCMDNDYSIQLFNRNNGKCINLGKYYDIEFSDNFIRIRDRINLIYEGQIIDVTEYYNSEIKGKDSYTLASGIKLLSKEDFFIGNEEEIRERYKKSIEENRKVKEREEEEKQKEKLQELQKEDEKKQKMDDIRRLEAVRHLVESVRILDELSQGTIVNDKDRIKPNSLIVNVKDHYEINPYYVETKVLKYLDLSSYNFENVDIKGLDFRGCNISLYPQLVYNKDLSNCNFEGIHIMPFMDFSGVNICGAKFSDDNNKKTLDILNSTFQNAIYDENTTYNGIPFTELFKEKSTGTK